MPKFSVTLTCNFPNQKALREAFKELNEFHDANVKIEDLEKITEDKNAVLEQMPEMVLLFCDTKMMVTWMMALRVFS